MWNAVKAECEANSNWRRRLRLFQARIGPRCRHERQRQKCGVQLVLASGTRTLRSTCTVEPKHVFTSPSATVCRNSCVLESAAPRSNQLAKSAALRPSVRKVYHVVMREEIDAPPYWNKRVPSTSNKASGAGAAMLSTAERRSVDGEP